MYFQRAAKISYHFHGTCNREPDILSNTGTGREFDVLGCIVFSLTYLKIIYNVEIDNTFKRFDNIKKKKNQGRKHWVSQKS